MWEFSVRVQSWFLLLFVAAMMALVLLLLVLAAYNKHKSKPSEPRDKAGADHESTPYASASSLDDDDHE